MGHSSPESVSGFPQIATMLTVSFAAAFVGWALVHLASSPESIHTNISVSAAPRADFESG